MSEPFNEDKKVSIPAQRNTHKYWQCIYEVFNQSEITDHIALTLNSELEVKGQLETLYFAAVNRSTFTFISNKSNRDHYSCWHCSH